ncbi:MAG: hypothetical protein EP329_12605 [Deltaproteobacteria bacterium]|nr:MAG: hypothetical protein EP329_12605 [Deltaproteobacteria bacterium]
MALTPLRTLALSLAAVLLLAACPDDGGSTTDTGADVSEDTTTPPAADAIFAFGTDPAQTISAAPFPNDLYLSSGKVALASLADDEAMASVASAATLTRFDGLIADKTGFGFGTSVYFPMATEPDLASFDGKVHIVALDGPEAGREVAASVFWYAPTGWLGVVRAFGDYQVPGTQYAVFVEAGVTAGGVAVEAPAAVAELLGETAPTEAGPAALYTAWAPLRAWLADAGKSAADVVVATVYTTEATVPFATKLFAAADAFTLEAPTRDLRWDADGGAWEQAAVLAGTDLDGYFGTPGGDFPTTPGTWDGSRQEAAKVGASGQPYTGGTVHARIGAVLNGTLVVPAFNWAIEDGEPQNRGWRFAADGTPTTDVKAYVPFTIFLCASQVDAPSDLPVAIATHGGGGHRSEMLTFAVANCLDDVATIAVDLPFHGGRIKKTYRAEDKALLPSRPDTFNAYTGLNEGDAGFVPDLMGDGGGPTETVGPLFALPQSVHPAVAAANTAQISVENHMVARYLRDADWSAVLTDLSFDGDFIFHEGLSFGASFTTMSLAMTDDFRGVVSSVSSGQMLTENLPVAPTNAMLAAGFMRSVLGMPATIEELNAGAWQDPTLATLQWLAQLGDPSGYAPFVMRHRPSGKAMSILAFGDSWDETLYTSSQLSMHAATGFAVYTHGADWTLDATVVGADTVAATAWSAPTSGNVTFGDVTHSAAMFYWSKSCHAETIVPICTQRYEHPHPPVTALAEKNVYASPVCEMHGAIRDFVASLLGDATSVGTLAAPGGSCDDLYGPP